jgi:RND family efflux transporter MFP subunit
VSLPHLSRRRLAALITAALIPGSVLAASRADVGPFRKTAKIKTAKIIRSSISQTVSSSGEIVADTEVKVKFQTSGRLAWVGVKEGDRVKKWQAIAALDRRLLEKRLKKDLNAFVREYTEFNDTQFDNKDVPLSETIARIKERAQIDLNQSIIDVEIRDIAIKYATIYSPIDGVVTKIDTPVAGVNITPATAVFTVADPTSLIFKAGVDETEIRLINEGQEVAVSLDALPDEQLQGRVRQVSFTSETASGGGTVFPVKVSLPELADFTYRIGMNGDAEFQIKPKENILVAPTEALLPDDKVWVKRGEGTFEKVSVETGIENDEQIEITNGLKEGDEVVVSGFKELPKN